MLSNDRTSISLVHIVPKHMVHQHTDHYGLFREWERRGEEKIRRMTRRKESTRKSSKKQDEQWDRAIVASDSGCDKAAKKLRRGSGATMVRQWRDHSKTTKQWQRREKSKGKKGEQWLMKKGKKWSLSKKNIKKYMSIGQEAYRTVGLPPRVPNLVGLWGNKPCFRPDRVE